MFQNNHTDQFHLKCINLRTNLCATLYYSAFIVAR